MFLKDEHGADLMKTFLERFLQTKMKSSLWTYKKRFVNLPRDEEIAEQIKTLFERIFKTKT